MLFPTPVNIHPIIYAKVKLIVQQKEIIISIEDNGKGITENDLKNIFQPFYRSEDSKSITGFGVGLAISKSNY